ncbi:ROK family protein [Lentilactobacillus kisonensis]|uniref:ROK family protein n=1 Tax=Lentilactobacillus kisonensis TaxID=481722 RepID=UPI000A44FACC|nr:ROK family protein [Lentilactobacillus kisonensis]
MANATGRELFHKQNLDLVLQQIFNNKIISRIDISRTLNLNKSTVSALYNELDEKGILKEVGSGESTSAGGRKPVLVKINERYGYTMNFDLGYRHLHVMGNYINGEVFYYQRIELGSRDIHKILEMIDNQIKLASQSNQTKHGLLGIGFSIHGIVQDNQVINSPFIDMDGVDLADHYSNEYHVPVILENEPISLVFTNGILMMARIRTTLLRLASIKVSGLGSFLINSYIGASMVKRVKLVAP